LVHRLTNGTFYHTKKIASARFAVSRKQRTGSIDALAEEQNRFIA